jgi:hypothetical protein
MDYRKEIINLSKQFPQLRFGQYLYNAVDRVKWEDMFNITDKELYEACVEFNKFYCKL